MGKIARASVVVTLALRLADPMAGANAASVTGQPKLDWRVQRYFAAKERQARQLVKLGSNNSTLQRLAETE